MKLLLSMLAIAAVTNAATSFSAPTQSNGTTYDAVDITGFSTSGADMAGLTITGSFFNGDNLNCVWAAVGPAQPDAGGCTVSNGSVGFQLALDGDTYGSYFNLAITLGTSSLKTLTFDGPSGHTTFDRTFGGGIGTDGSNIGRDADGSTSDTTTTAILYTNLLATLLNAPEGDEFATVIITFGGNGLPYNQTASWRMDTDSIGLRGGVPGSGTPEPATFGLMSVSLAGLLFIARAKKRRQS